MIDEHRAPTAAPPEAGEGVYVYAVLRGRGARPEEPLTGVGTNPAPVRAVVHDELAALVSTVPATWRAARRADIETHDRVLSALLGESPLIPMRFGVLMDDDDMVRERLLARHAAELSSLLERVDGRVQMSVKAYSLDEALLRTVLARRPDLKQRSDALEGRGVAGSQNERIALGRDVAVAVEEQRTLDQQAVVVPLANLADDVLVEASRSERHAFTLQLLIEAARRPELDAAVQRLAAEHGARFALRYVGPLPPYSFCELSLTTDEEPWA